MLAAPIGVLALVVGCAVNSVAAFEGERFAGAEPGRNAARRPAAGIPATEDLNAIVDGLQRKYSSIIGIAADFSQVYQGTDGRTVRESGRLLLKRPGKARWDYTDPEKKVFISDGKNVYFYVFGERQATRAPVRQSRDPQIPFLFLLGRGNLRRDFSRIEIATGEPIIQSGDVVLRLVPRNAPEDFKLMLAEIDPSTFSVRRLVVFERNGSRMDFHLKNVHENYVAPDSDFRFSTPPGVTVVQSLPGR